MDSDSPLLNQYENFEYPNEKKERTLVGSLSFLAAVSLCLVAALNAFNVFALRNPALYLLNVLQGFLGLMVLTWEGQRYSLLESYGNFLDTYFRFLSLKVGKGLLFLVLALLSLNLTRMSVLYYGETFLWLGLAAAVVFNFT